MMMATPGSDKMGSAKAEFFVAHFGVVLVDEWFLGVDTMRFYVWYERVVSALSDLFWGVIEVIVSYDIKPGYTLFF